MYPYLVGGFLAIYVSLVVWQTLPSEGTSRGTLCELRGGAWFCIVSAGIGIVFWFPLVIIGIINQL